MGRTRPSTAWCLPAALPPAASQTDRQRRWRRADLARAIEAKFGVVLAERTISTVLRRLNFRRLVTRPPPSRARRRGTSVFQANFAALVDAALPEHARGKPLELW